jgi:hypothetical protein
VPAAPRPPLRTEPIPVTQRVEERPVISEPPSRAIPTFLIHLVAAFAAGAVLLAIVAVIVTLVTSGRVALLELKGVPTAIAVASAVAIFATLRTARRGGAVAWATAAIGLLVIAGVGAYLYRPVYLHNAQVRLERALKVWSDQDATSVEDFRGALIGWNGTVAEYQRDVAGVVNKHITVQDFRSVAGPALQSLQEQTVAMQTHSTSARNQKLRDALGTLGGVYNDQLTGLRLVSSGILTNDFNSLRAGDAQYKNARERAATVFTERIRPLLERAGLETSAFEQALAQ